MLRINTDEPFELGNADIDIALFNDGMYRTELEVDNGISVTVMVRYADEDDFSSGKSPMHILVNVKTGLKSIEVHPSSKE